MKVSSRTAVVVEFDAQVGDAVVALGSAVACGVDQVSADRCRDQGGRVRSGAANVRAHATLRPSGFAPAKSMV
jgi:hypothetical protein